MSLDCVKVNKSLKIEDFLTDDKTGLVQAVKSNGVQLPI